ncbi:hypothetical protein CNMCM5623_005026 [Aspergillus felis]|uniref:Uncharacterized protein n=1 Tax=Aspergillus felis TaxID=1287682 RepID=A0A8H6PRC9_9EURO|nr:hypothetical protein CNMCM5623_005026 [Aspergillus felis]
MSSPQSSNNGLSPTDDDHFASHPQYFRDAIAYYDNSSEISDSTSLLSDFGGFDRDDDDQYNHISDPDHAADFQGVVPGRFDQLPTIADRTSTTPYPVEKAVDQLDFYPTRDMAHTPNTLTNTPPYSTEHGFANQRADQKIDQGAGNTTPGTSSCLIRIQGARSFKFFAWVAARWPEYSENFAGIAARTSSTPSHAAKAIVPSEKISM